MFCYSFAMFTRHLFLGAGFEHSQLKISPGDGWRGLELANVAKSYKNLYKIYNNLYKNYKNLYKTYKNLHKTYRNI